MSNTHISAYHQLTANPDTTLVCFPVVNYLKTFFYEGGKDVTGEGGGPKPLLFLPLNGRKHANAFRLICLNDFNFTTYFVSLPNISEYAKYEWH